MQHVRVSSQQTPVHKLGESQITLSPKFRLAGTQSVSVFPLNLEVLVSGESLIPGLPDDVALDCLLRLPVESHPASRAVCRRWHILLGNKERFFSKRKEFGYRDPWLFVFSLHKCTGKIQWHVLDLRNFSWHMIPPMPCKVKICPTGFRCVAIPREGVLFVSGGMLSDMDHPLDMVMKYEIHKNRWTVMSPMMTPRSFFANGMINGLVYVAGGNSSDLYELNLAEVFDPVMGNWRPIANMGAAMASYDAAVVNGKLLVTEGWLWPFLFSPRGQIYDPKYNKWEAMSAGLREGWTGLSAMIDDHLFVVSEHEEMKLKVYDMNTDSWNTVEGSPVPEKIHKPFSVNSCGDKIYVIGYNLLVAVGHLKKQNVTCTNAKDGGFSVQWQLVHAPEAFCGWAPTSSQVLLC